MWLRPFSVTSSVSKQSCCLVFCLREKREEEKRLDLFAFMDSRMSKFVMGLLVMTAIFEASGVYAWTGEIRGRVVCDVCADSSIGPEDHVLEGLVSLFLSVYFMSSLETAFRCSIVGKKCLIL